MPTLPDNIFVFRPDSKEFTAMCASVCPAQSPSGSWTVIKYVPKGWFMKSLTVVFLLSISVVTIFFNRHMPLTRTGMDFFDDSAIVVGAGRLFLILIGFLCLFLLYNFIIGRFDETWFLLTEEQLFIRKYRHLVPGYEVTVYDRKSIRSVECQTDTSSHPPSYRLRITGTWVPESTVDITYKDINKERAEWLTTVLSGWWESGKISES